MTYGSTVALDSVDLAVRHGSIHALLGGNGSGKSTLVRVLAGVTKAAPGGEIVVGRRSASADRWGAQVAADAGLRFVHQNPTFFPGMSVAENLDLMSAEFGRGQWRVSWREQRRRCEDLIRRFDLSISPDAPVDRLRPADRALLAIAHALADMPDDGSGVLVLDEPTASLPRTEAERLLTQSRRYADAGQGIILVSHRLDEVLRAADMVTVLRDGRRVGTFATEGLTEHDLAAEVMGRSITISHRQQVAAPGAPVLRLEGVEVGGLRDIDLEVREGEVVGIAGLLGTGRSSLLRGIFGVDPIRRGRVLVDGKALPGRDIPAAVRAGVAYVSEDRKRKGVFESLSVREHLSMIDIGKYWRGGRFAHRREEQDAVADIRSHRIRTESADAPITTLSGGNQQKVLLARWLRTNPRLLLLDEPTEGVDIGSRVELFGLVHRAVDCGAAALVVSSDLAELTTACDRVLVLRNGTLTQADSRVARSPHELLALATSTEI